MTNAMRRLGAKSIIGLLIPEPEVAFKILALNTEKAHNVKEKSLETIRMARALARTCNQRETDFSFEFEQPAFLTLGVCYDERPRLGGGAYQPILRRIDEFLGLFGELRENPALERAIRRAGRTTAKQYTWLQIIQRHLLPRLRLLAMRPTPSIPMGA